MDAVNYQYHQEQQQAEAEEERMMYELAIVQRIERGLATVEDARYVAGAFGLTTEWRKTHANG